MLSELLLLAAAGSLVRADRSISIENRCDYTIWVPAVSGTLANSGYTGPRGWEAVPKSAPVVVTIPETWNGRVWPRRGCTFDANGAGSCIAGNCPAGRDCADDTMGWANLLEMNLNQKSGDTFEDFWDISAVPGFVAPMSVSLGDASCHAVTCSQDLNPDCPEPLRLMEGSTVIGCLSACMAGINAGPNSSNCCSGQFLSHEACLPQNVDYYDYFKSGCPEAYAYPRDERPNDPDAVNVVYTCPSASAPSYTVVFCPDAAVETVGNVKVSASNVTMTDDDKASEADDNLLFGLPRTVAIVAVVVIVVLLIAAVCLFIAAARLHKREKMAQQQADEAQVSLNAMGKSGMHSSSRYRDASESSEEEEVPVKRSRSRRSKA
ncbi:hypothetical protein JCM6882_001489 [Rhodosporidiobolus microsporus]